MNGCYVRLLPGYAKIRENFHSYSSAIGLLQRVDVNKPLQKVFFLCLYFIYLFQLYDIPIIMLLTNKINKFCGEISNSRVILWVVYNCNVGARGT